MGGPRATSNVKRVTNIDEAEAGELLQEQLAVDILTPRNLNGSNFEMDRFDTLNNQSHNEIVFDTTSGK